MEYNKLYSKQKIVKHGSAVSKVKYNREYLAYECCNKFCYKYNNKHTFGTLMTIPSNSQRLGFFNKLLLLCGNSITETAKIINTHTTMPKYNT